VYQWAHGVMIVVLDEGTTMSSVKIIAFSLDGKLEMLAARASINT